MHLSTSSAPLDPTLLAGFPGATPNSLSTPPSATEDIAGRAADFGEVFAGLASVATTKPADTSGTATIPSLNAERDVALGAPRFTAAGLPRNSTLPPGLLRAASILAGVSTTESPQAAAGSADENVGVFSEDESFAAKTDLDRDEAKANAIAEGAVTNGNPGVPPANTIAVVSTPTSITSPDESSPDAASADTGEDAERSRPAEGSSAAQGLPTVALEHRATDRLPPGLTRTTPPSERAADRKPAKPLAGEARARDQNGTGTNALPVTTRSTAVVGGTDSEVATPLAATKAGGVSNWREVAIAEADTSLTDDAETDADGSIGANGPNLSPEGTVVGSAHSAALTAADGNEDLSQPSSPSELTSRVSVDGYANSSNDEVSGTGAQIEPATGPLLTSASADRAGSTPPRSLEHAAASAWTHASDRARFHREAVATTSRSEAESPSDAEVEVQGEAVAAEPLIATSRITGTSPRTAENPSAANFSVRAYAAPEKVGEANRSPKKTLLTTVDESDANDSLSAGTGIAKSAAVMLPRFPNSELPATSARADAALGVVEIRASEASLAANSESAANASVSSAHEAVGIVLRAVEEMATRERPTVNLQFSVGDAELAVRVELHANEVRATFRTDSPELRAALNSEWQSASASAGDRSVRIVPAVFGSSENPAFNAFSGDASSRQRERGESRDSRDSSGSTWLPRLGAVNRPAANVVTAPAAVVRSAAPTSRRLHTVA